MVNKLRFIAMSLLAACSTVVAAQQVGTTNNPITPATVQEQYRVPGTITNCVALHSEGAQTAANIAGGALAGFAGSQAGEWVGNMLGNHVGKDVAKVLGAGAGFVGGMMATNTMSERNFLCDVQAQVPGNRTLFGKLQSTQKFDATPHEVSVVIMSDGIVHFSVIR